MAMSDLDFESLRRQCDNMTRDKDRIRLVTNAVVSEENRFTCEQSKVLVDTMHYGDAMVECGTLLKPAVVDPEKFVDIVVEKMQYKEDKEALKKALGL